MKTIKKIYVLDTNIFLHNPNALTFFHDNDVIIPDVVLDELDKHKTDKGEVGYNSRLVGRLLSEMSKDVKNGNLLSGYKNEYGGSVRIEQNCKNTEMPETWEVTPDLRILRVCKGITEENPECKVTLVSNDSYMRIKAISLGLNAEEFYGENEKKEADLYSGRLIGYTKDSVIDSLYAKKYIKYSDLKDVRFIDAINQDLEIPYTKIKANEYVLLKSEENEKKSALCYMRGNDFLSLCEDVDTYHPCQIEPRNVGQKFILHALHKPPEELPLVSIVGPAGTGKTLLAIATALDEFNKNHYKKIYALRSVKSIEADEAIGFLPGDEKEKLEPFMRPIKDALEVIFKKENQKNKSKSSSKDIETKIKKYFEDGIINCEAIGFIRGRSIESSIIILDEVQNVTPNMIKTILSRTSKDSKIIIMGDINQIDSPYLDKLTNGLSYAINKMKGSELSSVITMTDDECVRSALSIEVNKRMNNV